MTRFMAAPAPLLSKVLYNNVASLRMCRRVGFVHIGGELPFL
jgi:hypothetical protein